LPQDTLRATADIAAKNSFGIPQMKPGTVTGSAAKGYAEFECDGSSYTKYGNRVDYSQLSSHTFK
jgi:hypothetical protein